MRSGEWQTAQGVMCEVNRPAPLVTLAALGSGHRTARLALWLGDGFTVWAPKPYYVRAVTRGVYSTDYRTGYSLQS